MRAQLVESFMADDMLRYREASAWLRDYVKRVKQRRGRVQVNENWFDPETMQQWRSALRLANFKRHAAKRQSL